MRGPFEDKKMIVSILTPDSKLPNLAAMKISAYHKEKGDEVWLNMPLIPSDKKYISILFDWTQFPIVCPITDELGGPGVNPSIRLSREIEACKPDYSLYPNMDYSLGYTYRACHRGCSFCKVKDMNEPTDHHPIWSFHDRRFKKIALMNNNTFEDPYWHKTFEEIWDEGLILKDVSGFDARLLTEGKIEALIKTRFDGQIHFAWDSVKDEKVLKGLRLLIDAGFSRSKIACYVLIGFDSTPEEDLFRIETLRGLGVDPFVMPFNRRDSYQRKLARWVNHKAIFKSVPWSEYRA